MKYIKIDSNTFIEYDPINESSTVLKKDELETALASARTRLEEIPSVVSDEELLAWARNNYPQVNYVTEIQSLNKIIAEGTTRLEAISG